MLNLQGLKTGKLKKNLREENQIKMLNGFIVENWKHLVLPTEDAVGFGVRKGPEGNVEVMIAVDGITRDPLIRADMRLPNTRNLFGKIFHASFYPRPSHAAAAAKIARDTAMNFDYEHLRQFTEFSGRDVLFSANDRIQDYQEEHVPNPDYLADDFPGCVASVALIDGRKAFWSFITDCGFAVFGKDGKLKFRTPSENPNSRGSIDFDVKIKHGTSFREAKGRRIIREDYRNNSANPMSYWALTGEAKAILGVRYGIRELSPGDTCVVYTDGAEEIILPRKAHLEYDARKLDLVEDFFARRDFKGLKQYCQAKVRTEGSLVYRAED